MKRYKLRTGSLEHQSAQLQAQVLALADANERLKQSLSVCGVMSAGWGWALWEKHGTSRRSKAVPEGRRRHVGRRRG